MKHYLVVLVPQAQASWRAHFPDFPGCRAEASSVEEAVDAAASAVTAKSRWYQAQGVSLPTPQTYEEVRHYSNGWAAERGIDWSKAVLSLVKLSIGDHS
jgi:predicted RNase H-like HicB family nuclease